MNALASTATYVKTIKLPINEAYDLAEGMEIPMTNPERITKVSAREFRGMVLVSTGGTFGLGHGFSYLILEPRSKWTGAVYNALNYYSEHLKSPEDHREPGDNRGTLFLYKGTQWVVSGVLLVKNTVPTKEAEITLKEVEEDWQHPGWGLSEDLKNGAVVSFRRVASFIVATVEYPSGNKHQFLHFRQGSHNTTRREYITPEQLAEIDQAPAAFTGGQLALF